MLQAQQILQQRYQLQQQLGNNPNHQTWLAKDTDYQEQVIVKLLPFSPQTQWHDLKLFERESQVLKHLNHPRIPCYRDYFAVDKDTNSSLPLFGLVQDYLPGLSLQQLLQQGKRFTEAEAKNIARQLLQILIYLHQLSPAVLHRDIKPSNIILGEDGQIYLVDFGAVQDRAKAEGVTFTVVGTGGYAPPEQLWGKAVPGSDLYALGATLIHLLTRVAPSSLPQQRMRLQFKDKVNLSHGFANWLEKLTNPAPEGRFTQAIQALSALETSKDTKEETASKPHYSRLAELAFVQYLAIIIGFFSIPAFFVYYQHAYSEPKVSVGSMNRRQQSYYLQNGEFSYVFEDLGLDIKQKTENYQYSTHVTPLQVLNYAIPLKETLKGYVGGVFLGELETVQRESEIAVPGILCIAKSPGLKPPPPIVQDNVIKCDPKTQSIGYSKNIYLGKDGKLAYSALNYATFGKDDLALEIALTIQNQTYQGIVLVAIAEKLITAGQIEQGLQILAQGLEILETIPDNTNKPLAGIARSLAAAGQYDQALEVAYSISCCRYNKKAQPKAQTLDVIIQKLVAAGEDKRAFQVAETIQSYYGGKDKMLEAISKYKSIGNREQGHSQSINDGRTNDELLSIIADPKVDKATLMETIQKLGPVTESAQFWTKITNSDEYSEDHRRFAVFQLFQRHVSPGMTMSELAYLLDNPSWLANKDIPIMTVLAGYIPIELTFEDPVFVLRVFHDLPNGKLGGAVYLRVSGQVDMESFIKVLQGETVSEEVRNAKILEFAPSSDSRFTGL